MKNIYLIPTDKPSRLYSNNGKLHLDSILQNSGGHTIDQHICITSDLEIKENDWCLDTISNYLYKAGITPKTKWENQKKIILTTDQDLIADLVQAIDDDFLEWFVKNSSCEEVEVKKGKLQTNDDGQKYGFPDMSLYEIIIPQEEPNYNMKQEILAEMERIEKSKKETLEEAALNYSIYNEQINKAIQEAVKFGSKWMEERMYSEEEVKLLLDKVLIDHSDIVLADIPEWFENNKKK